MKNVDISDGFYYDIRDGIYVLFILWGQMALTAVLQ